MQIPLDTSAETSPDQDDTATTALPIAFAIGLFDITPLPTNAIPDMFGFTDIDRPKSIFNHTHSKARRLDASEAG